MNDRVLSLLGLARRGGNLALGEAPVTEACELRRARLVLVAADAGDSTARRGARLAERGGAPLAKLPWTRAEVGRQLGRASCALLAVTDPGLAAAVAERLAEEDDALRPAAQSLAEKADRVRKRAGGGRKTPQAGPKPADR